jgi:hypothetical protein
MSKLNIRPGNVMMEIVVDKGKVATLEVSGTEKKSLEVLGSTRNYVFEELNEVVSTLKCKSKRVCLSLPSVTATIGLGLFCIL